MAETIRIEERRHGLHVGLIYVGYAENDMGKEAVSADGTTILLQPRTGRGLLRKEEIAKAVIRNIRNRKFPYRHKCFQFVQSGCFLLFPNVLILRTNYKLH